MDHRGVPCGPDSALKDSLRVVVDGVVADEQGGVEGLRQQGVDGDHHQQHRQLQHRVEPQEHGTRHHGQDPREHKVLGGHRDMVCDL